MMYIRRLSQPEKEMVQAYLDSKYACLMNFKLYFEWKIGARNSLSDMELHRMLSFANNYQCLIDACTNENHGEEWIITNIKEEIVTILMERRA